MAQLPLHVDISDSVHESTHDTILAAIALATHIMDVDLSETEIHIKQGSRPAHGWHGSSSAFSGAAYFWYTPDRKPGGLAPQTGRGMIRVQPGVRYLVTVKLTNGFTHGVYPFVWQYRRYKTAQSITLNNWQEELLHLLAHEFVHIKQYILDTTRSELECEYLAHQAVHKYRQLTQPSVGKAARKG